MSFLDFLYDRTIINKALYDLANKKGENRDLYICDFLLASNEIDDEDLAQLKSEFFGLDYTNLSTFSKISGLNYELFQHLSAIPFETSSDITKIAVSNPDNIELQNKINYNLTLCETTRNTKFVYYVASNKNINQKFYEINNSNATKFDLIIFDAIASEASDIHITPFKKTFKIMLRIDSLLTEYKLFDIEEFDQLKNSIKVISKLDISESRRPQSGHFQKDNIDFRVSTHPTYYGENIVIRILTKKKSMISIEKIGFSVEQINYLKFISNLSNGLIIFCGPTGSGKTTSIYSLIESMDKKSRNIMTLEDPIEYKITNIRQTEITRGIIDFTDGIKSILRQDPDVILIGEIRDTETAQMAIRASMTGHLVLSTIHANDSFGAIARLQEFNISNSLIADNLISIISQRLLRKKSQKGRILISEILKISQNLSELIQRGASRSNLEKAARSEGFQSMYNLCLKKLEDNLIFENDFSHIGLKK